MQHPRLVPIFAFLCLLAGGTVLADQYESAALLVFPSVLTETPDGSPAETFMHVTNVGAADRIIHISYINGDANDFTYCYECDFQLPLDAGATQTLVVSGALGFTTIGNMENTVSLSCPWKRGFVVVSLENSSGTVVTDNVLMGKQVVVAHDDGHSFAMSAIPLEGYSGNGDRIFDFDDLEYSKLPAVLAAEFHAPNAGAEAPAEFDGTLTLVTFDFERQSPPHTDCTISGYDPAGNGFSASVQFGCWGEIELGSIDSEFDYPNLGLLPDAKAEQGWMLIRCSVDRDTDGNIDTEGGVHGAIWQLAPETTVLRRNDGGPPLETDASWGRILAQSVVTGDAAQMELESAPAPGAPE